jgi:hypothetical protein
MNKEPAPQCVPECPHYKWNRVVYLAGICTHRMGCARKVAVEKLKEIKEEKKDE